MCFCERTPKHWEQRTTKNLKKTNGTAINKRKTYTTGRTGNSFLVPEAPRSFRPRVSVAFYIALSLSLRRRTAKTASPAPAKAQRERERVCVSLTERDNVVYRKNWVQRSNVSSVRVGQLAILPCISVFVCAYVRFRFYSTP